MSHVDYQPDNFFYGVWHSEQLVGFAHFRRINETLHLNNIAVLPASRGLGLGKGLVSLWMRLGRELGCSRLSLDVDKDNHSALQWYRRLGFHLYGMKHEYIKRARSQTTARYSSMVLVDWPVAEALQHSYGFSEFRLDYSGSGSCIIGRLGDSYFRLTGIPTPEIEGFLAEIEPRRRLLVIVSSPIGDPEYEWCGTTLQLEKELNSLNGPEDGLALPSRRSVDLQ